MSSTGIDTEPNLTPFIVLEEWEANALRTNGLVSIRRLLNECDRFAPETICYADFLPAILNHYNPGPYENVATIIEERITEKGRLSLGCFHVVDGSIRYCVFFENDCSNRNPSTLVQILTVEVAPLRWTDDKQLTREGYTGTCKAKYVRERFGIHAYHVNALTVIYTITLLNWLQHNGIVWPVTQLQTPPPDENELEKLIHRRLPGWSDMTNLMELRQ